MQKILCFAVAISLEAGFAAHADIIPVETSIVADGPSFLWTYVVSLTNDQTIRPGIATPTSIGGTIFDFGAIIGTPVVTGLAAQSFDVTTSLTSSTTFAQGPTDDASLLNINYFYNGVGSFTGAGNSGLTLLTIAVVSPFNNTSLSDYDGGAAKIAAFPAPTGNVGSVVTPIAAAAAVPEPASIAVLGVGLFCMALRVCGLWLRSPRGRLTAFEGRKAGRSGSGSLSSVGPST